MTGFHPPVPTVRSCLFSLCNFAIILYGLALTALAIWLLVERSSSHPDNHSVPVISIMGQLYAITIAALGIFGLIGKRLSLNTFFWYAKAGLVVAVAESVLALVIVIMTATGTLPSPSLLLWQELGQNTIAAIQSRYKCCTYDGSRHALEAAHDVPLSCLNKTMAQLQVTPDVAFEQGKLTVWQEGCKQALENAVFPAFCALVVLLIVLRMAAFWIAGDIAVRVAEAERAERRLSVSRPTQPVPPVSRPIHPVPPVSRPTQPVPPVSRPARPAPPVSRFLQREPPGPAVQHAAMTPVGRLVAGSQAVSRPPPRKLAW